MSLPTTYTDAYGPVVDTGRASQMTVHPVWVEYHRPGETDTGSKLTVNAGTTVGSGIPHFHNWQPENTPR